MKKISTYYDRHCKDDTITGWFISLSKLNKNFCNELNIIKYKKEDLPLKYR